MVEKRDNFIKSFKYETCRTAKCECGQDFYAPDRFYEDDEWDSSEDPDKNISDYKKLAPKSRSVDVEVWLIRFGGKAYVSDCDCWFDKAENVMRFLDTHKHEIASFFANEKHRKTIQAELEPLIEL